MEKIRSDALAESTISAEDLGLFCILSEIGSGDLSTLCGLAIQRQYPLRQKPIRARQ